MFSNRTELSKPSRRQRLSTLTVTAALLLGALACPRVDITRDSGTPPTPLLPGIGGVTEPEIISGSIVEPVFPEKGRKAGIEGKVILQAVVLNDGIVGETKVFKQPAEGFGFSEAAIKAVKQWRYKPATLHGDPVAVYITVVVNFTLANESKKMPKMSKTG